MNKARFFTGFSILLLAGSGWTGAQESNPTANGTANGQSPMQASPAPMTQEGTRDDVPLYRIQVVGREIPAINYFHRSSATKIGFQGTSLLPAAKGTAKVEARLGRTSIDASFEGLTPANGFGPEYLTYVLWAITPEGRPINLGEVLPTGSKDKNQITVTTNLQAFGLIVTAEPYFAVTMPSDAVVVQNFVEDRTQGVIEQVNAHYSLLPRGAYEETAGRHTVLHPITRDERSPLEVYEAINAVQIAQAAGADKYAADTMTTAKTALQNAHDIDVHGKERKEAITYAREAVQSAEDARIITIRKIKAEDEAAAQQAQVNAQQAAQQAQVVAQEAQAAADQQAAARVRAQAEADQARAAQQAAEQSAQQASQQTEQARERLRQQLNQVLQTTETARGLIVNMSDVLFDFNKFTLKPEAREKLAKVSGILLAYPNLKVQVEGYTDNIGTDEYNQKLSEERADGVREYLVSQSVTDANVTAKGYGKSDAVADNSTNDGRAKNRRVELVVSGGAIGIEQSVPGSQGTNEQVPPATQPRAQTSAAESNVTGTSNPPR
jgi:outer membrane protein OmpA-like peptidoglycan-associated protein